MMSYTCAFWYTHNLYTCMYTCMYEQVMEYMYVRTRFVLVCGYRYVHMNTYTCEFDVYIFVENMFMY